ncbi:MAG: sugar ABC transporter ATP-binding protein [Bacteroidia bacterium]|nr:sugar ABC transporter ATP-binding protein [Bacteroidia bacterium]
MRLEIEHITRHFPGVRAVDDVSLSVEPGEVHAVCGENGAGKSTLMHLLVGNLRPDAGRIRCDGQEVHFHGPEDAFRAGIAIVYQHLSLAEGLSVAENIFVNRQPRSRFGWVDYRALYRQAGVLLDAWQVDLSPRTQVARLPAAQKQIVEIVKALAHTPRLLILDEPTASLTERETQTLYGIIARLNAQGVPVLYISHRLAEIFRLADRITVLKDGKSQGTYAAAALDRPALIRLMTGRELPASQRDGRPRGEVLLEAADLRGKGFEGVDLRLHRGEILGLAGLSGAGRSEIARALATGSFTAGELRFRGRPLRMAHPADARGIAYVPEDRKQLGIFPGMSVQDNLLASSLATAWPGRWYRPARAAQMAREGQERFRIATPSLAQRAERLSGGNQQKVLLARCLLAAPELLIVDEPTHGVDVGAKHDIYRLLHALAGEGMAILVVSSELPELLSLCDRIVAVRAGRTVGMLDAASASEAQILAMIL